MDAQAQVELSSVGIALADLGMHIQVMLSSSQVGATNRFISSRSDQPPMPDHLVEQLGQLVEQVGPPPGVPVGVAVWDRVDPVRGEITGAQYRADWVGFPFAERLAARLSAPVRLCSGVNAAARAEALSGAAVGRSPVLYVHLGRIVESALITKGEPLIGSHCDEGRLHHWQTGLDGPRCACGAQGHLGALVSAQSLVRLAIGAASHDDDTLAAVHQVTHGRAEALTAPQLVALASHGVRPLRELVDYAVDALAGAIANLSVALDPAIIVIGGPLALADEAFFVWLRERVAARLGDVHAAPDIARASLGARAAVIGAASMTAG